MNSLSFKSKDLAKTTGIDIRFWRKLRDLHILHPIKVGKGEVWERKEVERFLEWAKGKDLDNDEKLRKELVNWND